MISIGMRKTMPFDRTHRLPQPFSLGLKLFISRFNNNGMARGHPIILFIECILVPAWVTNLLLGNALVTQSEVTISGILVLGILTI